MNIHNHHNKNAHQQALSSTNHNFFCALFIMNVTLLRLISIIVILACITAQLASKGTLLQNTSHNTLKFKVVVVVASSNAEVGGSRQL